MRNQGQKGYVCSVGGANSAELALSLVLGSRMDIGFFSELRDTAIRESLHDGTGMASRNPNTGLQRAESPGPGL